MDDTIVTAKESTPVHDPRTKILTLKRPISRPRKRDCDRLYTTLSRYTCNRCGENFTNVGNLNRHNTASKCSLDPLRYLCGFANCNKAFTRKDNREKHRRRCHSTTVAVGTDNWSTTKP
ncbi:hypothetical protein K440DRAFT_635425 [Wilcoxina mikolae CBS 423.85]|nr:hypothetical protein K440DRAFT_635425 [Wilcoxina mikolae CBS 423.85]